MADLGEGPGPPGPPSFWAKKTKMTEGRKARCVSKLKPGPLLSSKSGSVTDPIAIRQRLERSDFPAKRFVATHSDGLEIFGPGFCSPTSSWPFG